MGEQSDYLKDFPEENEANYVGGEFNPQLAQRLRDQKKLETIALEKANAEVNALIERSKEETKAGSLIIVEDCPQCRLNELNIYKISESFYLCECQYCGIYGNGKTREEALIKTEDAAGYDLDWRDGSLY